MFLPIRYLLHGQADKYHSEEKLYIISQSDSLWLNLAQQVLSITNESWRLINSALSGSISEEKFVQLGISRLTSDAVIDLLNKLRKNSSNFTSLFDRIELNDNERKDILNEIGKSPQNQDLWKSLPLHKTIAGILVSIQENTYLQNPELHDQFSLNQGLLGKVTLIKQNSKILHLEQEGWILQWNASAAMKVLLQESNPHDYAELILKVWRQSSSDVKHEYRDRLKEAAWLKLSSGQAIAPKYILKYPEYLRRYEDDLIQLNEGYHLPSNLNLPESSYKDISSLFCQIKEQEILGQILNNKNYLSQVILCILNRLLEHSKLNLEKDIIFSLEVKQWLLTGDSQMVSPSQVVYIPRFEREIESILFDDEYIPESKLNRQDVQSYKVVFDWLKSNLFVIKNQAWNIIGQKLGQSSCNFLGDFPVNHFYLDKTLEIFNAVPNHILPAWKLIQKVIKFYNSNTDVCKTYILPYVLKEIEEERLIALLNRMSSYYQPSNQNAIEIYNQYLKIATENTSYHFSENILPKILLISHNKQWQPSYQLWYGQDRDVFGIIDHKHILNEQQATILESHINLSNFNYQLNNTEKIAVQVQSNSLSKYDCLKQYFQNWEPPAHSEAIGAFICLIAGANESLQNLAQEFLGRRDLLDIFERFTGKSDLPSFEFEIEVSSEKTQVFTSITGQLFNANLRRVNGLVTTLFVISLDANTRKLVLSPIENPQNYSREELHKFLEKSAQSLIRNVYQVNVDSSTLNEKFKDVWGDLTKSDQLELQVARNVILAGTSFVVEMLGVHQRNEIVKELLSQIQKAVYQKEDYKNSNRDYHRFDQQIDDIKEHLAELLEDPVSNNQVSSDFLESVRQKIALYGYRVSSIPFEIFQNADDALIELEMMGSNQCLEASRLEFILEHRKDTITMMYWGRPINCFRHPQHSQNNFQDKGFERDLQKMLSFSQSNKYHTNNLIDSLEEADTQVTGKFGLGFKSVHLICKEPHVFSYRTGFKIVGGWLPSKLTYVDSSNLSFELKNRNPDLVDGTIIKLKNDPQVNTDSNKILKDFNKLIGLLLVFSKKIKTYRFFGGEQDFSTSWNPNYLQGMHTLQIGTVIINQRSIHALCLKLGNIGHFLISVKETQNGLESSLTNDIPTIWVTAPTQETLELNFIINGQFDLNTGRSTLIETASNKNLRLSQQLGQLLGEQLCLFFEKANQNWRTVQELLNLHNTTPYQFWYWMWRELVRAWIERDLPTRLNLIRELLGGNHGMAYLVTHHSALPNGLFGEYQCLVSPKDVRYIIEGILKQERYFIQVFQWQTVQEKCHSHQIIHSHIWEQFKKLLNYPLSRNQFPANTLHLLQILQWQLNNSQADIQVAQQIGELINKISLEDIKQNSLLEYQGLIDWLSKVSFLSQADTYQYNYNLLVMNSEDTEEKLLSAFAPDDCVLNKKYISKGLEFFYACRQEKSSIKEEKLVEWINMIKSEEQVRKLAVKDYLTYLKLKYGSLSSELAENLKKFDWLEIINKVGIEQPENGDLIDVNDEAGIGDPKWGDPGEELAKLFYEQIYSKENYKLDYNGGLYDYLLSRNGEKIKIIEVKTISSNSIRFPVFEWNMLIKEKEFYELFIVNHSKGSVSRVIRIQNVWDTLKQAFEKLNLQYLTEETENVESLIGLQKEINKNIIILKWKRLIDYYKRKNGNDNIMIYSCEAKLIEWKREVIPDIPHFKM